MDKQGWSRVFRARFERHEQELHTLYTGLYCGDEQAWACFVDMLRLIKMVAENAHKEGIRCGICGELGADVELRPSCPSASTS